MVEGLEQECDLPADIVLWHGERGEVTRPDVRAALAAAGDLVIGDVASVGAGRGAV